MSKVELGDTAGKFIGAAVPERLRDRWSLRVGGSRSMLPRVLAEVGEVNVFLADDATVLSLQKYEFKTVWPRVRSGGVVIIDDVGERFREQLTDEQIGAVHLIREADKSDRVVAVVHRR